MNESQRCVLQRHHIDLASDLLVTEELLGSLFQRKIFDRYIIELIKAEKTNTDQVHKLLELLPKRGPEAFDQFLETIKDDYAWLATSLETGLKSETLARQNSCTTICICGGMKQETGLPQIDNTPRPSIQEPYTADTDIKSMVGMFIHKQFGHSKRISQQDKKTMEKWLSEQMQRERKRLQKTLLPPAEDPMPSRDQDNQLQQQQQLTTELRRVYHKVHDENSTDTASETSAKSDDLDDIDGVSEVESVKVDDHMSIIRNLEAEVDKLINKINDLEGQITQCHYILGDSDKKVVITSLVKESQVLRTQAEKDLLGEKKKSEKMLYEIYDYSKTIHKMESEKMQQRNRLEKLEEETAQLKRHNILLQEKCSTLETANLQHLEKEKTLVNLRQMVKDLQTSRKIMDENANVTGLAGNQKGTRRAYRPARRGSIVEANIGTTLKKGITRPGVANVSKRRTTRWP